MTGTGYLSFKEAVDYSYKFEFDIDEFENSEESQDLVSERISSIVDQKNVTGFWIGVTSNEKEVFAGLPCKKVVDESGTHCQVLLDEVGFEQLEGGFEQLKGGSKDDKCKLMIGGTVQQRYYKKYPGFRMYPIFFSEKSKAVLDAEKFMIKKYFEFGKTEKRHKKILNKIGGGGGLGKKPKFVLYVAAEYSHPSDDKPSPDGKQEKKASDSNGNGSKTKKASDSSGNGSKTKKSSLSY